MNYHTTDLGETATTTITRITPAANPPTNESPKICAKSNPKSNKTPDYSTKKTSPKALGLKTPINESTKPTTKAFTTLIINVNCPLLHNSIMTPITIGFYKRIQALVAGIMYRRLRTFIKSRITPKRPMPRKCNKSRKVSIMRANRSRITLSMIRQFLGKRPSLYPILSKFKGSSNKRIILKVLWCLRNINKSSFSPITLI